MFSPLYTGNPKTGTLTNSEYPDEMQHNAVFHQVLHSLLRLKQSSETEIRHNLEKYMRPLKLHNGQFHTYDAVFHQGLHCLLRLKQTSRTEIYR